MRQVERCFSINKESKHSSFPDLAAFQLKVQTNADKGNKTLASCAHKHAIQGVSANLTRSW